MWQYPEEETLAEKRAKVLAKKARHKFNMTCSKNRSKRRK